MTPEEYIHACLRTESIKMPLQERTFERSMGELERDKEGYSKKTNRLLHTAMGTVTEAGEFLDAFKKALFYKGTEDHLDTINLGEELGDLCWYISIALDALGLTWEEIWQKNIAKLRARYPEKFTEEKALNRDLDTERKVLEGSVPEFNRDGSPNLVYKFIQANKLITSEPLGPDGVTDQLTKLLQEQQQHAEYHGGHIQPVKGDFTPLETKLLVAEPNELPPAIERQRPAWQRFVPNQKVKNRTTGNVFTVTGVAFNMRMGVWKDTMTYNHNSVGCRQEWWMLCVGLNDANAYPVQQSSYYFDAVKE